MASGRSDARKAYERAYRSSHRELVRTYAREYARRRSIDPAFRAQTRQASRRQRALWKEAAINVYSNGEAVCKRCGQGDLDMLCLDHINDDGKQHRDLVKHNGNMFYMWLGKHDYPHGLQVLCYNCNMKKEMERLRHAWEH